MHQAFESIGRFSVRFKWAILVVWIVAAVAIVSGLPSLASVVKNDNSQFLPANAPSQKASDLAAPFGNSNETPNPVIFVNTDGSAITPADLSYISSLTPFFKQVNTHISGVRDIGVSADGKAEQISVLALNVGQNDFKPVVDGIRAVIKNHSPPAGLVGHVTGPIAIQVDTDAKNGNNGNAVQGASFLVILIILLLIFRAPLAPIVTVVPALMISVMSGPVVAELAKAGLKVSVIAQLLLIVLILGAGTDYGLFLVFRVREHLRQGMEKNDAIVHALSRVGESITFSAGTVVAALMSLFAASFGVYKDLGAPLAVGIVIMLLAALTLLPALLSIFGRAVFWPSRTRPLEGGALDKVGAWGMVSARVTRRPKGILAIGLVVFIGLAVGVFGYKSAGFGGSTDAPAGTDALAGSQAQEAHYPAASANPTNIVFKYATSVWDDPTPIQQAQASLESDKAVFSAVNGPLSPNGATITPTQLTQLHKLVTSGAKLNSLEQRVYAAETTLYVSKDGLTVNFNTSLTAGDPSTTKALQSTPQIRAATAAAAKASGAVDSGATGEAPALYDVSKTSTDDLKAIIPIAIVVIGLLLALVMRSLVAPLYLIVSVGLSYLAALGLSVFVFVDILGDGGLTFILPFLMFLFLLALGEDYNILVMTRIREEAHHTTLKEAVKRALFATGTTVTSAGIVLAATFGVFAVVGGKSGGSQIRDVGAGLAIGILMDTFLVRTLLVPSTVLLLGRWNWWPSKMSKKDFELEEDVVEDDRYLTQV